MCSHQFLILFLIFSFYSSSFCHEEDEHLIIRTIEKLPVHTEVANLRRLFFPSNVTPESLTIDFSLAKRDEFPYMFFLINHSSRGILTIRKEIDRDELCRKRRCRCDTWCDLELEIFVNSEQFNIELLTIRILDQNDHNPQFASGNHLLNLTIVENAPIGAMIKLESAVDYDQGFNGIVGYSLLSSTALPFSLRYDLIRADLSLVVTESLDRELISFYQFQIIAHDGGNRTGVLNVRMIIDDVNDSPPKFEQSIYTLMNISENLPIGSILFRVHATDADEGVNGDVTYQLINSKNCFEIDPFLGDIRILCALDYETKTNYRLDIEARDGGEGSKTDFCTLNIHLVDENDNYPIIDFYPNDLPIIGNTIKLSLSESLPINSLILSFSIIDRDSGENGRVTWQLDRNGLIPFELIHLTDNTGELRTKRLLDREYISEYNFTLEATDHGKPQSKSNRVNLHLILFDENDNAPKFRQENPRITINEHVKINDSHGYEVYRIQAEDFDIGRNGEIVYSIINDDKQYFQIDSHTGIIRALVEFDRREQSTHLLHIQARDKGIPTLSSETKIIFTIIPRNEHAPKCFIENNRTNLSIVENTPRGTLLTMITCMDDDHEGSNGEMSIEARWLPEETISKIPFVIRIQKNNRSNMEILLEVNDSIDRELIPLYSLFLTISDQGNPRQSTNLSFIIDILDDNDHCPQLHIETSFILINRDITSNDFLLHLIASDDDQGSNGEISFELSSSTSPPFVRLYSNGTLFIQTNSTLIRDDSLIILHIQIRDHGQPTPCLIVETLRLFIGSNRTDWMLVLKNNDEASLRFVKEQFQQGKRMAHVIAISSTASLSVSVSTTRKQLFAVFLGSAVLISVVIITMILCFVDRLHRKLSTKNSSSKCNGHAYNLGNGKRIASSSPLKTRFGYDDDSPTHHYTNLKTLQPVMIVASSSSSSSVDSTTRINTAQNRLIKTTYSYTPIGTSDELMPIELDEEGGDDEDVNSGIELMMTTV